MQHNLQQKTKSHILRNTEDAKRKSRHRLMGSIFLLLIALVVLLNVTSKVKQIPVNPKTIEIQNTDTSKSIIKEAASGVAITKSSASQVIAKDASSIVASNGSMTNSIATTTNTKLNSGNAEIANANGQNTQTDNGYRASVLDKDQANNNNSPDTSATNHNSTDKNATNNSVTTLNLSPRIVVEKTASKLTPEQILNGETASPANSKYYVQLTASGSKDKLIGMKQKLSEQGVRTIIQQVKTSDGTTVYRLRMGPFSTRDEADSKLSTLNY